MGIAKTIDDLIFDEAKAGEYLGGAGSALSPKTMQKWRCNGSGPAFIRISSRCIRYRKSDLDKWIEARLRKSTTDAGLTKREK